MKIDLYKHEEIYSSWMKRNKDSINEISDENSQTILKYLSDMEKGINVSNSSVKGARSYSRLNAMRSRLIFFSKKFKELYGLDDLTLITEDQIIGFFSDIRKGVIKKSDGKAFTSPIDYVKGFKSFWHWWQKVNRRKGIEIKDITQDLDKSYDKPGWVYLTEDQVKQLSNNAEYKYNVLIWFLFDSGIRAPTELVNVRVTDFHNDFKEIHIREETSKTFGRRIKLMISTDTLKEYIKTKERITQLLKSCLSVART